MVSETNYLPGCAVDGGKNRHVRTRNFFYNVVFLQKVHIFVLFRRKNLHNSFNFCTFARFFAVCVCKLKEKVHFAKQ